MDILGGFSLGKYMPDFSGLGSGLLNILLIIIVIAGVSFGLWYYLESRKYKYKIEIYEKQGGTRYTKTMVDWAKIQKIGDSGEEVLVLRRLKKILPANGQKMGSNLYCFAIGQDGYWYNFTLGDLDAKQGLLDIEPIDRDMRYMHVAIRRNMDKRFNKGNFMDKYGAIMINGIFLLIMLAGLWFLIDKLADMVNVMLATQQGTLAVTDKLSQILGSLDNVCSNSGIKSL